LKARTAAIWLLGSFWEMAHLNTCHCQLII